MSIHLQDATDPYRSVIVAVDGPRSDKLIEEGLRVASVFLVEPVENLWVSTPGVATAIEHSRYRQHLGVPAPVTRWTMRMTIQLRPALVRERRGHQKRNGLRSV